MCIFCKIAENEIPSFKLYEDENFMVILDKFPASLGDALVIPKKHVENIYELAKDAELTAKAFELTAKTAVRLKGLTGCEGINILQNNGEVAGQTINHFHIHVILRNPNDNVNIHWDVKPLTDKDFEDFKTSFGELL